MLGSVLRRASLIFLFLLGCHHERHCDLGACPQGAVCDLDGLCRPLAPVSHRFSRTTRLPAGPTQRDQYTLGARPVLRFDLGDIRQVQRATLGLRRASPGPSMGALRLRSFPAGEANGAGDHRRVGGYGSSRGFPRGAESFHLDVTAELHRALAQAHDGSPVAYIGIDGLGDAPGELAGAGYPDVERRPVLTVWHR